MNDLNIPAPSPRLQDWDPGTFFYILDRIDRTPLENAVAGPVAGPRRRGPKLKELDAVIGLYLWYRTCQEVRTNDPPTPTSLRRELEDPKSDLAKLCGFDEGTKLPVGRTLSNHFRRIEQHRDLVAAVLLEINQWVPPAGLGKESPKPEKTAEEPGRQKESGPRNRNGENGDYRRYRRQEAVGDREIRPVVGDEASARDFFRQAVHGGLPKCYICPKKREQGWTCIKEHVHEVVVEVRDKQGHGKCLCCESKLSITSGTVFHGTNFSCQEILIALRYMIHLRSGVSAQDVAGFLNDEGRNVSEGAVRMLMHRLRECMWEEESGRFEGETEIDEMLLRLLDGRLVSILTAYNRVTRRVRFKIVERKIKKPKANKREMLQFIRETTVPGSTILTDGDASIPKPEVMRRKHSSVIHKRFQFLMYSDLDGILDKPIEVTTNRVEGKHASVRRTLRIRNGISRHHLDRYLQEAAWRINHLHNRLESQNYDGEERRNFALMRDVLAGAAGRKLTLEDLRGEPLKKCHSALDRNRTAPVSAPAGPQQRPLLPPGPIVTGASQSGSGKVEVKSPQTHLTAQSEGGEVKAKPDQTCPGQMTLPFKASQTEDEQPQPVLPEETAVGSQPAQSGPLEELEQVLAAMSPQRGGLSRRHDPVTAR